MICIVKYVHQHCKWGAYGRNEEVRAYIDSAIGCLTNSGYVLSNQTLIIDKYTKVTILINISELSVFHYSTLAKQSSQTTTVNIYVPRFL